MQKAKLQLKSKKLPSDLEIMKLEQVITDIIGGDWGKGEISEDSLLCRVLRGTDFAKAQDGFFDDVPTRFIKKKSFSELKLKQGDILIELSGGSKDQPTGRVFIWRDNLNKNSENIIFSNFVKKLRLDCSKVEPEYFYRYWQHLYFLGRTTKYEKRTTGIRNFKYRDFIENEKIFLPPLDEQQKIVYVLDPIQEAVRVEEEIIEKTKELKRSLMADLFKYGGPSFRKGRKLKKTEIGEIPENWEVRRFMETLDKKTKFSVGELKQKDYKKIGKYPIVDQGNENIAGYSNDERKVYSGKLPVIIFGDHTRIVKFVNFPFIIGGGGVKILIPKKSFNIKFFYYLLSDLEIESRGYNRHFPILKEKHIPLPPLPEQREIAEILQTVDQKIEIEQRKKALYEELFKSMLNQLMTGKIRVNNLKL